MRGETVRKRVIIKQRTCQGMLMQTVHRASSILLSYLRKPAANQRDYRLHFIPKCTNFLSRLRSSRIYQYGRLLPLDQIFYWRWEADAQYHKLAAGKTNLDVRVRVNFLKQIRRLDRVRAVRLFANYGLGMQHSGFRKKAVP